MKKICYLVCILMVCCLNSIAQNVVQLVPFSSGYNSPLGLENCGDSRLFVVQKTGQIMLCDSAGRKNSTPFLDLSDRIISTGSEQGLLGLAFHPKFAGNGYLYVDYINKNGNIQISRFQESSTNHNVAIPSSEFKILEIQKTFIDHNAGCLRFGPDGYLYIGTGDGGVPGNSQNPSILLGKILRIDINSGSAPYLIPTTNPFVNKAGYRPEIWALGLRNPWRFSQDFLTGRMYIGDVGQENWEELDFSYDPSRQGGENFGWPCYEGNHPYKLDGCPASSVDTFPKYEYSHASTTGGCSIIGGFVYRGTKYPFITGKYFFTDLCSGIIRSATIKNATVTVKDEYLGDKGSYTSFGEDSRKELYVVNIKNGSISRLVVTWVNSSAAPVATASLSVFPNPAKTFCTATYTTTKAENCTISLYNSLGVPLATEKHMSIAGKNTWQIAIPANLKGNGYITITNASGSMIRQSILIQ